jgi:hypothetical protein
MTTLIRLARRTAIVGMLVATLAPGAAAQGGGKPAPQKPVRPVEPRLGTFELSAGGFWSGGDDPTSSGATLTRNQQGGGSFDLFRGDPSLGAAFGGNVSLAMYITRRMAVEGGFQYGRPQIDVRLTGDSEDAPDLTASSTLTQYVISGSLLYHFGGRGRMTPFLAGGAGHVRDVHEGNDLVETGTEYHGTGGIKMWFGRRRNMALRLEGGVSVRDGGFTFDDETTRIVPTASASFGYRF